MKPGPFASAAFRFFLPVAALLASVVVTSAADLVLYDFTARDLKSIDTNLASVAFVKAGFDSVLQVRTAAGQWPGITVKAPRGTWDLSDKGQVAIRLRNNGEDTEAIFARVDNAGADGAKDCASGSITLKAGEVGTLRVALKRNHDETLGGKLFGMRGYPVARGGQGTVDPAKVTQVLIFLTKPSAARVFEVHDLRATGTYTPPTAWVSDADPFFPLIDTFGQYRHKKWPGKIQSAEDLVARREREPGELRDNPGPPEWNVYGGWKSGPKLQATGFFRTEKVKGKWWLVDPNGNLFFSQGIDCVRMLDTTPIQDRDSWFAEFPGENASLHPFLSEAYVLKGFYAGKTVRCFSFAGANLVRKYGPAWENEYRNLIHQRLRSWGINTIGNWSDETTFLMRKTPYTDAVGSGRSRMIEGSEGYWGKFPDVFDPSFAESLQRSMERKKGKSAGDPWCIGYFSDNEMSWGDETSIPLAALKSGPTQPAKVELIRDLRAKYGDIASLNTAWGCKHESWEAFAQSREAPDNQRAHADLATFYTKAAEKYFSSVRAAIKALAPQQLYLGCRFAWVNSRAAAAAARYCDVVSYNLYSRTVSDFEFNGGADVPLIIGEFHFGALDRGMFHTGLVPVANQNARAQAYKDYVLGALKHPQFVGCHWFQYQDEPTTGRVYDEENYQIGFVDVADTPYAEIIRASREVAGQLYR